MPGINWGPGINNKEIANIVAAARRTSLPTSSGATQAQVAQVYENILGRNPFDPNSLDSGANAYIGKPLSWVQQNVSNSPEAQSRRNPAPAAPAAPATSQVDPLQAAYNALQDATNNAISEMRGVGSNFNPSDPFAMDDANLSKYLGVAKQTLDPFFNQQMSNFTNTVKNQRAWSLQDEQNLLNNINADTSAFTGQAQLALNTSINNARNGYAAQGLYSSGLEQRAEGNPQIAYQNNMANFQRQQSQRQYEATTAYDRYNTNLTAQEQSYINPQYGSMNLAHAQDILNSEKTQLNTQGVQNLQAQWAAFQPSAVKSGVNPQDYKNKEAGLLSNLQIFPQNDASTYTSPIQNIRNMGGTNPLTSAGQPTEQNYSNFLYGI